MEAKREIPLLFLRITYTYFILLCSRSHLNGLKPEPGSFSVENRPHQQHGLSKWVLKTELHMYTISY